MNNTGSGTRRWTEAETQELLARGRVTGYQGHHINSVDWALNNAADPISWIRSPDNITFFNRADHLTDHGGNFANWTTGPLLNRSY